MLIYKEKEAMKPFRIKHLLHSLSFCKSSAMTVIGTHVILKTILHFFSHHDIINSDRTDKECEDNGKE